MAGPVGPDGRARDRVGARLTFNFWRKGGYARGGEDYRWAILRQRMPAWAWQAFNIGFVAGYQNLLILGFTLPAWLVAREPTPSVRGMASSRSRSSRSWRARPRISSSGTSTSARRSIRRRRRS